MLLLLLLLLYEGVERPGSIFKIFEEELPAPAPSKAYGGFSSVYRLHLQLIDFGIVVVVVVVVWCFLDYRNTGNTRTHALSVFFLFFSVFFFCFFLFFIMVGKVHICLLFLCCSSLFFFNRTGLMNWRNLKKRLSVDETKKD